MLNEPATMVSHGPQEDRSSLESARNVVEVQVTARNVPTSSSTLFIFVLRNGAGKICQTSFQEPFIPFGTLYLVQALTGSVKAKDIATTVLWDKCAITRDGQHTWLSSDKNTKRWNTIWYNRSA